MNKDTLTDRLLLLIADYSDFSRATFSISRAFSYMSGNPDFQHHRKWMEKYISNKGKRKKLYDTLYALYKRKNLKKYISSNGLKGYALTDLGNFRIFQIRIKNINEKKLPREEKLLVFFDIPEKIRKKRDALRSLLKSLGFEQIQKSIWITQYDVRKKVKEIIKEYGIQKNVHILLVKNFY